MHLVSLRNSFANWLGAAIGDKAFRNARAAINYHKRDSDDLGFPLHALLEDFYVVAEGLDATDPRDHVFALLGMSADVAQLGITPDYSKSAAEVFTETAIALIRQQGLKVLTWNNADFASSHSRCSLPSWAPDWTRPFLTPFSKETRVGRLNYNASRCLPGKCTVLECPNGSPRTLTVSGIVFDSVYTVGEPLMGFHVNHQWYLTNAQSPDFEAQLSWLSEMESLSKQCGNAYGGRDGTEDAVWRTPITNKEFSLEAKKFIPASERMKKGYTLYRKGYYSLHTKALLSPTLPANEFHSREDELRYIADYWRVLETRSSGRRYFVTRKGYLGVGPPSASTQNLIAVVQGLDCPLVLRTSASATGIEYKTIGDAHIHGIMDGEALEHMNFEDITIA